MSNWKRAEAASGAGREEGSVSVPSASSRQNLPPSLRGSGLALWQKRISDLISGETDYLSHLSLLREFFAEPLASKSLRKQLGVKKKVVQDLFQPVNHLWTIHKDLCFDLSAHCLGPQLPADARLSQMVAPPDVQTAAQVTRACIAFGKLGSLLVSSYSAYPGRYRVAMDRLKELGLPECGGPAPNTADWTAESAFVSFVRSQEARANANAPQPVSLVELLHAPLERIQMYVQFLDRARRHGELCLCPDTDKAVRDLNPNGVTPAANSSLAASEPFYSAAVCCQDSCNHKRCKVCQAYFRVAQAAHSISRTGSKALSLLGSAESSRASAFQQVLDFQARLVGDIDLTSSPTRRLLQEESFEHAERTGVSFCLALFNDALCISEFGKKAASSRKANSPSRMEFRRLVPLSAVHAFADTDTQFTVDAFGWRYKLRSTASAPAFLKVLSENILGAQRRNSSEDASSSEQDTGVRRGSSRRIVLTRDRALSLLERTTRMREPPRLYCKVQCRWNPGKKCYDFSEGYNEVGNKYEIGRGGAIFGRDVDFDSTDGFTRVLITSDDGVSRRNRSRLGHCQVWWDDDLGRFMLRDLGSTGGTFATEAPEGSGPVGEKIHLRADSAPVALSEQGIFQIGQTQFVVMLIETTEDASDPGKPLAGEAPESSSSGHAEVRVPATSAAANMDTFEFSEPGGVSPFAQPLPQGPPNLVSATMRRPNAGKPGVGANYGQIPGNLATMRPHNIAPAAAVPVVRDHARGNDGKREPIYEAMPEIPTARRL